MNDKSNILGSLEESTKSMDLKQQQQQAANRPTSGISSSIGSNSTKQHKLKQRFTVIRKLGKGTYGKVQLAINKQTGQEVAIKTIKKTKIENEQDLQRVRREIQIMSSIEHPHIIHIYEVFENKDKIVLVMQYAPGGELYEYVSQSKVLDDFEARRLFRQIATAIYYCHQNKICHRDLKLENILLDEKNNAKLADFGLSNVFDKNRFLKTFCGSPLYASPEIVQGSPYEGPEVDCWSLGVLLYTLVYGAMPFDGSNFKRLVKQISEACYFEPKQRSLASPLIRSLLCADPGKRATILDICSDPWVNGLSTGHGFDNQYQRISPNEQQQQQQQQQIAPHNSLLQVAQDMAKLTPVRLDILLALAPTSPTTASAQQQENNENKPPPPSTAISAPQAQKRPPRGFATGSKRPPSLDIDPSLMEVDETTLATPPVASYIVRDLEVPGNDVEKLAIKDEQQQQIEKVKLDEEQVSLKQEETRESEPELEVAELKVEPQQIGQEVDIEVFEESTMQPANDETKPKEEQEQELEKDKEGDHSVSDDLVEQQQESEVSIPKAEQQVIAMDVEDEEKEVEKEPQVEKLMSKEENIQSKEENVQSKEETQTDSSNAHLNQEQQADTQTASEEPDQKDKQRVSMEETVEKDTVAKDEQAKPKKVKKKIVVVKKRKKVAKKDAELVSDENNNNQQSEQEDKIKGNAEQVDEKKQNGGGRSDINGKKRKPSAPGKVKIPDTFQASPTTESSQTPPRSTPETRRQSALVADVSQKLLQQLQNIANESIKSEQPQLHGVKVADKKDEFERRASQAMIMASTSTPTKVSQSGADYEPEKVDSLCESISLLDKLMQTIVEPVEKLEPLKVELLELIKEKQRQQSIDQASSRESQTTPTSSEKVQQLDLEIKRKLSECAEKLDAEYNKQKSNQNQKADTSPDPNHLTLDSISSARDDRSDSVETIKAESLHDHSPARSVHSSIVIDLGPKKVAESSEKAKKEPTCVKRDSATSLNSQMAAVGPVPIARSYKKVTFTKDGACITETGKIYSTKGDDGTMRRIERKSKITHYPNKSENDDDDSSRDSSIKQMKQEEEEVCEEEVVYRDDNMNEQTIDPVWRKETRQASSHRSLVTGKPFEKLIMPSTGFMGEFDDYEFERHHPLFSRSSGRESIAKIGRNDSNSSCSSSSTDFLDDIFDTWTGAISMFNQKSRRGSSLFDKHNVMFERAFGGNSMLRQSPLFSPHQSSSHQHHHHHKQGRMTGGSVSGTPRSESVEPQFQKNNRRHQRYGERRGDTSGYDSDAPTDRPASALAGARDLFGSSNLFSRQSPKLDSFFNDDDNSMFERDNFSRPQEETSLLAFGFDPHMSLRQRLAQQHKQLWKGSTPSLFDDRENQESQFKRQQRQHQNLSHFLRPQELQSDVKSENESAAMRARSGSASQNQSQQTSKQQSNWSKPPAGAGIGNKQQNLEQSQSSSSFLKGSTAMSASPIRKNTAHIVASSTSESLPPSHPSSHSMQKSISKTSFITSQMSNLQLGSNSSKQQQQQVAVSESASFIELKRSPSSQSNKQRQQQQQQQQSFTATTTATSKIISTSTASNASSAFWEGRVSPFNCGDQPDDDSEQQAISNQDLGSKSENVDTKVQNWLQESSENISSSLSGSQSSASDMTHSTKGDPYSSSLHGNLQKQSFKPGSIHSATTTTKQSSMLVSSSSKQSISSDGSKQQLLKEEFLRRQKADFSESDSGQVNKATKVSTATFTLRQKSPNDFKVGLDSPNIELQSSGGNVSKQESKKFSSASKISTISTTAPIEGSKNFEGLNWMETMESTNSSSSRLFGQAIGGENLDHHQQTNIQDSCESVDTESKSSSSLLDQLKSRGYRSMIDQRMVSSSSSQKDVSTNQQQQQQQQSISSTSSTVIQSSSRVVMSSSSSSGSRVIQTKKQQISNISEHKSSNEPTTIISDESASQKSVQDEPKLEANFETKESEFGIKSEQTKLEDSNVVEENSSQEVGEKKLMDTNKGGEDEEEDDDVREAKANIKPYLDSVKETDMFLKKMHEEEENFERQRQQLFIFNNLMLHTKLNGINSKIASRDSVPTSSGYQFSNTSSGIRSAPVGGGGAVVGTNSIIEHTQNNVFIPSLALNYEPTYTIPSISNTSTSCYSRPSLQPTFETPSFQRSISTFTAPIRDPLEPVQPLNVYSDTSPSRYSPNRRSKSQLSDQFSDYKRTRPVSANLDLLGTNSNPYFPSRSKRSLSQLRYPTRKISQPIMSEYRSSYVNHSLAATPPTYEADNLITTSNSPTNLNRSDDSDDGMSSYRVSSYVPKIVPQEMQMPHRQGRTFQRRSYRKDADLDLNSQLSLQLDKETLSSNRESYVSNGIVERRTSLQPEMARKGAISPENSTSPSSPSSYRRLSLNETANSSNGTNEGSRLSQLEQRIQENKKRREKLLQSTNHSPVNERKSNEEVLSALSPIRNKLGERDSPGSSSTSLRSNNSLVGLKAKPSRLESMEARIKRKSYCMRVADCSPDRTSQFRGQMSLEKWRSTSTAKSTGVASSSSSPRNSLTNVTKSLFYALSDNPKSNRTSMDSSSSPLSSNVDNNVTTQTSETNGT